MLAVETIISVVPDKAFYRPGEPIALTVRATGGAQLEATITYLAEQVGVLTTTVNDGAARLMWTPPPDAPRGYGVDVRLLDANQRVIAAMSTAFDVLERWIDAPRYGFLSEFSPGRDYDNAEATMDWITRFHINGLQFYDWQYRHETLLPPENLYEEPYTDLLGRALSLEAVNRLIEAAHRRNIAAMPYTAIYGASVAFYREHPDWALFEAQNRPYEFGENFMIIMDPTPGSPWATHLLGEFAHVLRETAFDGIHIDQYGAPMRGRNAAGERVRLDDAFPAFINEAAEVVQAERGDDGVVIFNAVRNWPIETVAPSGQDAVYIEVWEPYRYFMDLPRIVAQAERLGNGKPVIIAAYISPDAIYNVRLANALIFASGGYHLELGEPNAMLADPYFPRFGIMTDATAEIERRYYDFLVRYENVLAVSTSDAVDSGDRASALVIEGSGDRVAVIVRQQANAETFSLVNMTGIDSDYWDVPLTQGPTPLHDLSVSIVVDRPVRRVWAASPDGDSPAPIMVAFTSDENAIDLTVPALNYWTMLVVEYEP